MATKTKERSAAAPAQSRKAAAANAYGQTNGAEPLNAETLKRLYSYMLKCRTLEERARILFKQGKFAGNYYAAVGQEATEVGCTIDLEKEDCVAPSHRDFIAHIMKGTPLKYMFAQLYARKTSPDQGRSSPAHCGYAPLNIITPASTIAAQLNIGTGVALAYKLQKKPNIVVALSGDGSTSLGFWHEALNFAGVMKLPIVYVVQNNRWAESVSVTMQTAVEDLSIKAQAYGFAGVKMDGNDAIAVYAAVKEAVDKARNGGGPTLIECETYRIGAHSSSDDPTRYRDEKEVEQWKKRDPLDLFRGRLQSWGMWSATDEDALRARVLEEVNAAIAEAEKKPDPPRESLFDDVYAVMPWTLREQREEMLAAPAVPRPDAKNIAG